MPFPGIRKGHPGRLNLLVQKETDSCRISFPEVNRAPEGGERAEVTLPAGAEVYLPSLGFGPGLSLKPSLLERTKRWKCS